jgi:hypothetical protein
LREEKDQRMRIFIRDVKDKARVVFEVKHIFWKQPFLSRLTSYSRYSSDTTLSHPISQKNQVLNYMYARIKFHTYSDIIVNNRNNIT